eukprot:TRINITY_DN3556_c0_g1_i1.p1 TRINITY_DN3556_c0_g1~~TRINITY_DN3556_c0_g1_i1.p1  ORF type:complete len:464 (+),score=67.00 TRINITY_DN3556_c0_g1_i1:89-1480(+)
MWRCCAHRKVPSRSPALSPAVAAPSPAASSPALRGTERVGDGRIASVAEAFSDDFLEKFRTREPLHLSDVVPRIKKVFDVDSIMSACARSSEVGALTITKHGELFMRESFYMAYLDNATLSLGDAEQYFPGLLDVCQVLAPRFGYATARLVIEPPKSRSPSVLVRGDVFVLQISGEQKVTISQPSDQNSALPVTAPRPQPSLACTIRPGDVVFVPTGAEFRKEANGQTEHDNTSSSEPLLSVLITVRTEEHSLRLSLAKFVNDALRESMGGAPDAFLRSAVTKSTPAKQISDVDADPEQRSELEAKLRAAVADLRPKIGSSALRDHFEQRMEKLRQEQLEGAMKRQSDAAWYPVKCNAVLSSRLICVSRGVSCRCSAGDRVAHFKRGSETLSLPIERSASYLISELCDGKPHLVSSLPCRDEVERLCVCQILVHKECLVLVDENDYTGQNNGHEFSSAYSGGF